MNREEFERVRREMDAALERHRAAMSAAHSELRAAMAAANRAMRVATERARPEMQPLREGQGRKGQGRKGSWWEPFLRAQGPQRPPRRPRKDGGEPVPAEPRPVPTPLQGGAEAPVE